MIEESRIPLDTIKEICKQSGMWELDNPRVIGMMNNILLCLETEEDQEIRNFLNRNVRQS